MTRVLFVCIGNSCRSPMAEAFARRLGDGVVEASSAGIFPAAIIQPETLRVMAERDAPVEDRAPRSVLAIDASRVDLLINMSGRPLAEALSAFAGREIGWDVQDPIGASLAVYRSVRDEIERRVADLIRELRPAAGMRA